MKVRCDLHIHSCLSPCGGGEMTPRNITGLSALLGLELIALTDHNTCGNCRAAMAAGADQGLPVVPGMELTVREEAHILCFFPDIDRAERFSAHVYGRLPPIPNDPAIFGPQQYRDGEDRLLGEEPRLLLAAADIGAYEVQALCRDFGGVAVPAHLNKSSYSILSALGYADPAMGFPVCEVTASCRAELLVSEHPELAGVAFIKNSDAHYLEQLGAAGQVLELEEPGAPALVAYFQRFLK